MQILFISCGNADYDGRLRELLKVTRELGEVICYSYGSEKLSTEHHIVGSDVSYLNFIKWVLSETKTLKPDVIFADNRRATIPAMIINRKKKAVLVQDCRELYDASQFRDMVNKIGCFFEKKCAHKADVLICANSFRADYMERVWKVRRPIVFENVRKLKYDESKISEASKLIDPLLKEGETRIVSTYGCSLDRTNDVLVRNINKIEGNIKVFLVGDSDGEDEKVIRSIIEEQNAEDKVVILRQLNHTELKYLIINSHIGVVNYNQNDLNNKYCASGKIYEFVYEGLPVITTTNPPLKYLCENYHIGEADDQYYMGINKILRDYDTYKENVERFASSHTIEDNDGKLLLDLKEKLSSIQ